MNRLNAVNKFIGIDYISRGILTGGIVWFASALIILMIHFGFIVLFSVYHFSSIGIILLCFAWICIIILTRLALPRRE